MTIVLAGIFVVLVILLIKMYSCKCDECNASKEGMENIGNKNPIGDYKCTVKTTFGPPKNIKPYNANETKNLFDPLGLQTPYINNYDCEYYMDNINHTYIYLL